MQPNMEHRNHSGNPEVGRHLAGISSASPFGRAQLLLSAITQPRRRPSHHENRAEGRKSAPTRGQHEEETDCASCNGSSGGYAPQKACSSRETHGCEPKNGDSGSTSNRER